MVIASQTAGVGDGGSSAARAVEQDIAQGDRRVGRERTNHSAGRGNRQHAGGVVEIPDIRAPCLENYP